MIRVVLDSTEALFLQRLLFAAASKCSKDRVMAEQLAWKVAEARSGLQVIDGGVNAKV